MNAIFAVGPNQSLATCAGTCVAAVTAVLFGMSPALAAEGTNDEVILLAQANTNGSLERSWTPQLEVSATSLPRFDNTDGSARSSRIDMTLLPPRRSALGLSMGMTSSDSPSLAGFSTQRAATQPSVDVGLHWRYRMDSNYRLDVTAWRRLVPADALTLVQTREAQYGARVEMQLTSLPKSGFAIDKGFVGLQLESGARVTLKRSGGKPMMYYRSRF